MKNKILFLVITIIISFYNLNGQNQYRITKVMDTIYLNNIQLKKGDYFANTDPLVFKNTNGLLKYCCSESGGQRVVWGKTYVSTNVKSLKDYENHIISMSARNQNLNLINFYDFLKYPKIGIIDTLKIPLKNNNFIINVDSFFYVRFKHKDLFINKKLITNKESLLISNYIFQTFEQEVIEPDSYPISFYHYDRLKEESTLITSEFYPVFISRNTLIEEVSPILQNQEINEKEKLSLISEYVATHYRGVVFEDISGSFRN